MKYRSNRYWEKRSVARMAASEKQSIAHLKNIQRIYRKALKATTNDLRAMYAAYYKKSDKIFDIPQLDNAATQGDIKRFLAAMKKAGLSTYLPENFNGRISRLELLEKQIWGEAKKAAMQEGSITKDLYRDIYEGNYYRTGYDYAKGMNTNLAFSKLDTQTIDTVLSQNFVGSDFSKRIWNNTDRLAGELKEILGVAIATGQSQEKTIRLLRERFNVATKKAARLVRTETAYFHNRAELDAYEAMGFEKYQIVGTLDNRCCAECQEFDLKTFDVKDKEYGVNAPPFHPYCRCTEIAYFDRDSMPNTRMARDPKTGKSYQIDTMSYDEWRKSLEDEYGRSEVDNLLKKSYKEQYAIYSGYLGKKNMPAYEDFFRMQVFSKSDKEKEWWENAKSFVRQCRHGNISDRWTFKQWCDNQSGRNWKAVDFSPKRIDKHYSDHVGGAKANPFEYMTKAEYVKRAAKLLNSKDDGNIVSFISKDGEHYKYDIINNEFAIARKCGIIKTYYKPTAKERYWNRQKEKYGQ